MCHTGRPYELLVFDVQCNSHAGARVDVFPNGEIHVMAWGVGALSWVSLDGIHFDAR